MTRVPFLLLVGLAAFGAGCSSSTDSTVDPDGGPTDASGADTGALKDSGADSGAGADTGAVKDSSSADGATDGTSDAPSDGTTDTALDDTGGAKKCGGVLSEKCGTGEFCKKATGTCASLSTTGLCTATPSGCTKVLDPVCGCDGTTYGNPCLADAAGINIASKGSCPTTGKVCGGKLGGVCASTEWCDYADTLCGAADGTGLCTARPSICSGLFDPVCGCDSVTYSNGCEANKAGFDARPGKCP